MFIYETRYTPAEGAVETSRFISDRTPEQLHVAIRERGNDVDFTTMLGDRRIPMHNQTIYVNTGWIISMLTEINADENGCIQYISDCRTDNLAQPELVKHDVTVYRMVQQKQKCLGLETPCVDSAEQLAVELAESAEEDWEDVDYGDITIGDVERVYDHTCKYCENEVHQVDAIHVDHGFYHLSCWKEVNNS